METDSSFTSRSVWTGRCKWFNRQAGWGFLTLTRSAGLHEGKEVFVHYKNLKTDRARFKYLQTGEYVEFGIEATDQRKASQSSETCAVNVTGIEGGPLMCDCQEDGLQRDDHAEPESNSTRGSAVMRVHVGARDRDQGRAPVESRPWYVANK